MGLVEKLFVNMKTIIATLCLFGSAAAFVPAVQNSRISSQVNGVLDDMAGSTLPIPQFDPLNLASAGSDETLAWFRAAELKHGRVAMLEATGAHFPGMLSSDVSFESLSQMKPFDAWDNVPNAGKAQILAAIFATEMITEASGTHYTKGGDLPTIVFPAIDFSKVKPEALVTKRNRELNNGRLAMIAIMSFISAVNIPGSVPGLINNPAF